MDRSAQHTISGAAHQNEVKGRAAHDSLYTTSRPMVLRRPRVVEPSSIDVSESAGSQPSTVLDSGKGGASASRGRAKTGRAAEKGVGDSTRLEQLFPRGTFKGGAGGISGDGASDGRVFTGDDVKCRGVRV